jgi:4-alpha-glucanotransferase
VNASIFPRCSGILLHVTSLPGGHGIGDLGNSAYELVEFLAQSWQKTGRCCRWAPADTAIPPTSYSRRSPAIRSSSRFVDALRARLTVTGSGQRLGLAGRPRRIWPSDPSQAGFNPQSGAHISGGWHSRRSRGFRHFAVTTPIGWMTIRFLWRARESFKDAVWADWDLGIRQRDSSILGEWRQKLSAEIEVHKFAHFEFFSQWQKLAINARVTG